uniref:Retrovirus-related Pol polyprotein from transposon TNT 1-94 n=1 Tax=Tanacetum cinerariifolium TaxID=118510 RepID=A0A6L2LFS4_TANCI|nr:retrovirus-related Pol polyprotein from transposon TNT 1-94 [Tanacetum cinerariifolium]
MSLSLAENVIVARADNIPLMLDKTNYSSWEVVSTVRARTYTDLTDEEKLRESVDIMATNIVLQVVTPSPAVHQQQFQAPVLQQSYQAPTNQQQSQLSFPELDSVLNVPTFNLSYDPIASLNKAMAFLSTTFASRFLQINNQLRIASNPKNQATIQDVRVIVLTIQGRQTQGYANNGARNMETNPVIEEMSSEVAKCNKVQQENNEINDTLTAELERYKEQVNKFKQRQKFDLNDREKYIDGQLRHVIIDRNAKVADFEKQIHSLKLQLNATVESHKTLSTTVKCLKKESKQTEDKYIDEVIDLQKKNKALDNVVYKMKLPALYDGNTVVNTHVALFITDAEETLELAEESSLSKPDLKKEIPRELPSISLKQNMIWGVDHIKGAFKKDVKPFAQTLKEYFCMFEHGLHKELKEMQAVFTQMETEVAKCSVDKKNFEIEKKELSLDNDHLIERIICQDVMYVVMHANNHNDNVTPPDRPWTEYVSGDRLKHENDRLMEVLISKDLVHTAVNSLAAINDYKSVEQSFVDEYEENLKLQTELANKNDMIEKAVYNELSKRCSRLENQRTNQCSFLCLRYNKTAYELMHDKKPDLSYLHVFGCYSTNDNEDLGKLKAKADIAIFISYAPEKKAFRPAPQLMTLRTLSSGLVPNPITQPPYVSPTKNDWDILFQPMFDEFFNLPPSFVSSVPAAAVRRLVDLTGSLVSTSLEHDAPSASTSSTKKQEHSLIISQGVKESPKTPHFYDDPLHETLHKESTSQGSSSNVRSSHTPFEHLGRWTNNHLIANVIGDPSCSISTRKKLKTDAMWCYFDAFLTSYKPKNFKVALLARILLE